MASGSPASTTVREASCLSPAVANSPDFSFAPVLTGGFRAGDNEYCKLSDMVDAVKILSRSLALVNESAGKRPQTPAS